jgi:hypothetical protein
MLRPYQGYSIAVIVYFYAKAFENVDQCCNNGAFPKLAVFLISTTDTTLLAMPVYQSIETLVAYMAFVAMTTFSY